MQIAFTVVSVLLILVIMVQQKSSALGSMMGADSGDEMVQTRRGSDKVLHNLTVILGLLFVGMGLWMMYSPS